MNQIVRKRGTVVTRDYGKVQVQVPGGYRETTDFTNHTDTSHVVDVEVDIDGLIQELGPQAVRSKGGRTVLGGGLVTVRRVKEGK